MTSWRDLGLIIANDPTISDLPPDTLDEDLDEVIHLRIKENEMFKPILYISQEVRDNYNRHAKFIRVLEEF
jgi:hypothetical protein